MKQYLTFLGDVYYPSPSMGDFIGDFETKEAAIEHLNEKWQEEKQRLNQNNDFINELRYGQIYDSLTQSICFDITD